MRATRQSKKVTRNVLQEGTDPRGRNYYWLLEQEHIEGIDPQSDYAAIFAGAASITPLHLDRTHESSLHHLSAWASKLEARNTESVPLGALQPQITAATGLPRFRRPLNSKSRSDNLKFSIGSDDRITALVC